MNELITDPEDPRIKVGAKFRWEFETTTTKPAAWGTAQEITTVRRVETPFTIDERGIHVSSVRDSVSHGTGWDRGDVSHLYLVEEAPDLDKPIRDSILKTLHESLHLGSLHLGSWFNADYAQAIIDDLRKLDLLPKV